MKKYFPNFQLTHRTKSFKRKEKCLGDCESVVLELVTELSLKVAQFLLEACHAHQHDVLRLQGPDRLDREEELVRLANVVVRSLHLEEMNHC